MNRNTIFKLIDEEREYQDRKWGDDIHPIPQYLIDIETHLNRAKQHQYNLDSDNVKHEIRKIATLCVKLAEKHDLPSRSEEK